MGSHMWATFESGGAMPAFSFKSFASVGGGLGFRGDIQVKG